MSDLPDPALPAPDRIDGAPHPRETVRLFGHDAAEAEFRAADAGGRLHSGWLISGQQGIGKATLAYRLAAHLIGNGDSDLQWLRAGSHPRLFVLKRGWDDEKKRWKTQITVDEARKLRDFFHLSAADGGRRAVIVDSADEMNPNAANAILKLLEEPPPRTTLLMVAHQPARLLPTIRSRCRVLRLHPLAPPDLAAALAQIDGTVAEPGLAVLAAGSVGAALRLTHAGGAALYADLVRLLMTLPRLDRATAGKLAESCAGPAAKGRLELLLDLADLFLARAARAGLMGPPATEAATGEAALLARLSPDDHTARRWAELQQVLQARARHGQAVNLDPASLILDMLIRIEDTARMFAAA